MKRFTNLNLINDYESIERNKIAYINVNEYNHFKYGYVYLIVTNSYVKIGISSKVFKRINTINHSLINDAIEEVYISSLCSNNKEIEAEFKFTFAKSNKKYEWFTKNNLNLYLNFLNNQTFENKFMTEVEYIKYNNNVKIKGEALFVDTFRYQESKWNVILDKLQEQNVNYNDLFKQIQEEIDKTSEIIIYEENLTKRFMMLYNVSNLYDLLDLILPYRTFL